MQTADYIIVDGSAYLYRAYHALPDLITTKGQSTGAIKGVVSMLKVMQRNHMNSTIIVVFDAKGKTFRGDLYPEYKANRPAMPNELSSQIVFLKKIIAAMGLPIITKAGVEADDVIASLVQLISAENHSIYIASSDKDLMQLVGGNVKVLNSIKEVVIDATAVQEKFGVLPTQITAYLALLGDVSDNIPGVPKIGAKTAAKLLSRFGSLDDIVNNIPSIKGKIGENLAANLEQLQLSYKLVQLKTDVDLDTDLSVYANLTPDTNQLTELFTELEFKAWLNEINSPLPTNTANRVRDISSLEEFDSIMLSICKQGYCAINIVADNTNYMQARLISVSLATSMDKAVHLSFKTSNPGFNPFDCLKKILLADDIVIVGHNIKFLLNVLHMHNFIIKAKLIDLMLMAYVWNMSGNSHDVPSLVASYLDESINSHAQDTPEYSVQLVTYILKLWTFFEDKYQDNPKLHNLFFNIELPLVNLLSRVECYGTLIDQTALLQQDEDLAIKIKQLEQQAYGIVGNEFNLSSPKQLQEILYVQLKLPVIAKTPKGQPSTAENVLQELAADSSLAKIILEHRSLSKLKSSYTTSLPKQINATTARVHPTYHQALTTTGRLSCSEPNLQNIPIRHAEGRKIRRAFVAPSGYRIVSADYSQIELRLMAHFSGDDSLLSAFNNNLDIHAATAAEVLALPIEQVTGEQRRQAKAVNFGLIYGMSAFGLAKQLKTTRQDAQEYIDLYFHRYPKVLEYMNTIRSQAEQNGYVETVLNRRLFIANIDSKNHRLRQAAQRAAINGPMQGSAADIIKLAMLKVDDWIRQEQLDAHIIMQVHDELVLEVEQSISTQVAEQIKMHMSQVVELSVPLLVNVDIGNNWEEAH